MRNESDGYGDGFIVGLTVGAVIVLLVFLFTVIPFVTSTSEWHADAIKHHAAHYDAVTGAFTWDKQP